MVIWSALKPLLTNAAQRAAFQSLAKRFMSEHRTFVIKESRWQWDKFKDYAHFYTFLGVIPLGLLTLCVNVFVGPATLTEIPEGYTPKHWEYHQHPISRFLARYVRCSEQQDYEKMLHYLYEEEERIRMRRLAKEVEMKIAERHDYQAYYYQPVTGKYLRMQRDTTEYVDSIRGDF